jgi:ABC-type oligopeptide transport system substrate-binding subunit
VKEKLKKATNDGRMDLVLRTYNKTAHKLLAEWAQGQWEKKLGIRIPVQLQEGKVYWKEISVNPAPIYFSGVTAPFGHPRAFLQEFLASSTANWTGWSSSSYDQAVEHGDFQAAQEFMAEAGFVIPIYSRDTAALVNPRWKSFHINPLGQTFFRELH